MWVGDRGTMKEADTNLLAIVGLPHWIAITHTMTAEYKAISFVILLFHILYSSPVVQENASKCLSEEWCARHTTPVLEQGQSTVNTLWTLVSVQYEGDQQEVNIHFMIIGLTATNFKYYAYCPRRKYWRSMHIFCTYFNVLAMNAQACV